MKIIANECPPIYDKIPQAGMQPTDNAIYTYGDTIYNRSGGTITPDLMIHEETHCIQQGNDPDGWWDRYLNDGLFRIQQEVEAYANQYKFICQIQKDRNRRDKVLRNMATILSSPTYGSIIGSNAAYKMIKDKANE